MYKTVLKQFMISVFLLDVPRLFLPIRNRNSCACGPVANRMRHRGSLTFVQGTNNVMVVRVVDMVLLKTSFLTPHSPITHRSLPVQLPLAEQAMALPTCDA